MPSSNHPSDRLRQLLRVAYHEKKKLETGNQWQHAAMRRIRILNLQESQPSFGFLLGSLLWRMAPIMVVLNVVAGIVLANFGLIPGYDLFEAFGCEPLNMELWRFFVL